MHAHFTSALLTTDVNPTIQWVVFMTLHLSVTYNPGARVSWYTLKGGGVDLALRLKVPNQGVWI